MYSLPKGLVFRGIEADRPEISNDVSNTPRSRYVCYGCSREVHALVICDGPICKRCTGLAKVQRVLTADEPIPEPQTAEERRLSEILAKNQAMYHFRLSPPKKPTTEKEPA